MKCFTKFLATLLLIFINSYECHRENEEISLDAFSLISSQLDFLEDMCENRTGDTGVFDKLKGAVAECREGFLNDTPLSLTFKDLIETDPKDFYELYTTQCNNQNATRVRNYCNDKLKILLSQCLLGSEIEAFNKMENIASRIYDVICSMDQNEMRNFFSQKGQECMIDNVITIGYCYLSAMPDNIHDKQVILFNLIEGKECKVVDDIEDCIMTEIDACDEKSVSHIFHLLFKLFRKELACGSEPEDNTKAVINGVVSISSKYILNDVTRILSLLLAGRFLVTN